MECRFNGEELCGHKVCEDDYEPTEQELEEIDLERGLIHLKKLSEAICECVAGSWLVDALANADTLIHAHVVLEFVSAFSQEEADECLYHVQQEFSLASVPSFIRR